MAKKVKGKKKLNKAITKLVKPFGISEAKLSKEFAYYFNDEHIDFCVTCNTYTDNLFDEFVEKEFGFKNPYPFIISILHEIGHHMTGDQFDDIYDKIFKKKDSIDAKMAKAKNKKQVKKLEFEYFALPDEWAATEWAVDYFTQHREECDEMYKKACKALCKFYKKNKITEG